MHIQSIRQDPGPVERLPHPSAQGSRRTGYDSGCLTKWYLKSFKAIQNPEMEKLKDRCPVLEKIAEYITNPPVLKDQLLVSPAISTSALKLSPDH